MKHILLRFLLYGVNFIVKLHTFYLKILNQKQYHNVLYQMLIYYCNCKDF